MYQIRNYTGKMGIMAWIITDGEWVGAYTRDLHGIFIGNNPGADCFLVRNTRHFFLQN
jgi:hypothetical protein